MSHSKAKLNAYGRRLLCERIAAGFPVRVAARMVGISHARAYLIWGLYRDIGARAFEPRSSRPQHIRRQTPPRLVRRIEQLRRRERIGPRAIGWALGLARSTVYAVLRRLGLGHLKVFRERRSFRRYERHFRARGEAVRHRRLGYVYEHALVDDRTRTSYRETWTCPFSWTVRCWRRCLPPGTSSRSRSG